jgi:hypothetical protein
LRSSGSIVPQGGGTVYASNQKARFESSHFKGENQEHDEEGGAEESHQKEVDKPKL